MEVGDVGRTGRKWKKNEWDWKNDKIILTELRKAEMKSEWRGVKVE